MPFGAFVQVGEGIEGLVHISEMAEQHVEAPEQVVTPGEELWVKIIDIDLERRRISLSIKQAAEGGEVAAEYREFYGEHAYDEHGNYIGPEFEAAESAAEAGAETAGAEAGAPAAEAADASAEAAEAPEAEAAPPAELEADPVELAIRGSRPDPEPGFAAAALGLGRRASTRRMSVHGFLSDEVCVADVVQMPCSGWHSKR